MPIKRESIQIRIDSKKKKIWKYYCEKLDITLTELIVRAVDYYRKVFPNGEE